MSAASPTPPAVENDPSNPEAAYSAGATRPPSLLWTLARRGLVLVILAAIIIWGFSGIPFDFTHLSHGLATAANYVWQMIPHNGPQAHYARASFVGEWQALLQTIQMAIAGTVLGTLPAFLVSFLAARTTSLFRPLSTIVKTLLNIGRAVPILIYGLIVVQAIGLGPSAGTLAIAIGSFVMLSKLYAEAMESVALGPVEAVKAAGGNAIQVFVFGMLPQVFPNFLSATLYALELNLQASFILALVGAGGIGFDLNQDIQLDKLIPAGVIIAVLVVLVNCVDYLSYRIRQVFS